MGKQHDAAVEAATRAAIKRMRGQGLTQTDIAKQLGTSQANVSRWERGATTPLPVYRQRLAAYTDQPGDAQQVTLSTDERLAQLEAAVARIEVLLTTLTKGA